MTVQTRAPSAPGVLARRKVLALGAASLVTAALAACGGEAASTATGASGTVNAAGSTVQAASTQVAGTSPGTASTAAAVASQLPGAASGLLGTAQAAVSQVPGASSTIQAAGSTVQSAATQTSGSAAAAASGGDPASRNNKYQGKPPAMTIDKTKKYFATIVTNKGTMKAELYADTAPITVNNFVFLANDHFYDGVIFHRIVKGFVIQGGDPTGTGTGGPGYKFSDEPTSWATRNYEKGTLAMANSGPNTNGSQFFICLDNLTAQNKLPKQYNIFGKVTDGVNVIDAIAATPVTRGATGENSTPTEKVFMQTVTISMM